MHNTGPSAKFWTLDWGYRWRTQSRTTSLASQTKFAKVQFAILQGDYLEAPVTTVARQKPAVEMLTVNGLRGALVSRSNYNNNFVRVIGQAFPWLARQWFAVSKARIMWARL